MGTSVGRGVPTGVGGFTAFVAASTASAVPNVSAEERVWVGGATVAGVVGADDAHALIRNTRSNSKKFFIRNYSPAIKMTALCGGISIVSPASFLTVELLPLPRGQATL